ncbi:MAG: ABC transporter ATP-binding protein [Oscillospiraceae bacterium]|nr:ABC transporter ATP-binding protein [Oscillospiraceae bacterium]
MSEKQNEAFLSVKDIEVIYTSGKKIVHAVNGVSFDMKRGETLGLVGETGAGKTTIARAILRILPDPPAIFKGGRIELDGVNLIDLTEEEMLKIRGDKIAMIFQDPMTALNPLMTVGDQILEVLQLHNKSESKEELIKRAGDMLELVNIPRERYGEYPHQFSGGMKQRVVIAMALACDPQLLLADEPTTALDVTIQAQVLDLIRELREKYQTSMILITHDLGVVAETCDKVAVIYAGEIVEYGDKRSIYKHTTHPYTIGLFDSLPDISVQANRLKPISGMPPDPTDLPEGCAFSPRCPYATEECRAAHPQLREIAPGHFVRCCLRGKEE